jgi:hypothetical protein
MDAQGRLCRGSLTQLLHYGLLGEFYFGIEFYPQRPVGPAPWCEELRMTHGSVLRRTGTK